MIKLLKVWWYKATSTYTLSYWYYVDFECQPYRFVSKGTTTTPLLKGNSELLTLTEIHIVSEYNTYLFRIQSVLSCKLVGQMHWWWLFRANCTRLYDWVAQYLGHESMKSDHIFLPLIIHLLLEQRFNTLRIWNSAIQQTHINTGTFYGTKRCHSCRPYFTHVYSELNYACVCYV